MSRIVVKNLPKGTTAKKLEEIFSAKGEITDLQLKYNKQGVFRQFAFIGFKTEEEATRAKEFFHNNFIHTSKIQVEICTNLSDPNKPKPWKKVAEIKKEEKRNEKVKSPKIKKKAGDFVPEELKNDPQFKEYLGVNEDRKSKPVWGEDVDLKSSDSENGGETSEEDDQDEPPTDSNQNQEEQLRISKNSDSKEKDVPETKTSNKQKKYQELYTVKLTNLPYHCKKTHIKKFFASLKIASLRIPPKKKGFAFVGFKTEKDMKQALIKNKGFLEGRCIQVLKYVQKNDTSGKHGQNSMFPNNDKELNEELLGETGRIYVRNLCYTVTEDDIEKLFQKYGPIAELHVPIDFNTKKSKGFAFVTFMFAEHAVKAFSELDGTIFQGRLLHLIPARAKKEFDTNENETNFKKKKEAERKKESGNSQNWNILFLGMNAVADAVSEKYKIEKSELLSGDAKNKKSVAVRMALAETEMVEKTRTFLIENGVQLDAFSQPAAQRSKTVLVVKHLPAKTTSKELHELFSKHGNVSRVLLPPSGMVALIEFENPTEARTAFTKLAYRKFHNLPLFLEWAPMNGLKEPPSLIDSKKEDNSREEEEKKESSEQTSTDDVDKDIPVPEGATIYVKNINFSTTQENLEKHFKQCGPISSATISTKIDPKTGKLLSMGFGFVQFRKKESAIFALQNLQQSVLDEHALELKFANRSIVSTPTVKRKKYEVKKQTSSKILVRNVPFQASVGEVRALFKEFGTLKMVRLPKKLGKHNEHRGFGFVEYEHAEEAERAFEALCHSTHLFNRRLVLEWANTNTDNVSELREKTASRYFENEPRKKVTKAKLREDVAMAATRQGAEDADDNEDGFADD